MGLFDAVASTVGNLTDNVLGMVNQNHQNKVNLRVMREQNSFNAEQSQIQRDWQERMWGMNNAYNSPDAMIARGLNPFIQGSASMAGSRAPATVREFSVRFIPNYSVVAADALRDPWSLFVRLSNVSNLS